MKVPGSKIVPCQGVLGSNHSLTFGLFTQVSGLGPLGPLVASRENQPGTAPTPLTGCVSHCCIVGGHHGIYACVIIL